MEVNMKNKNKTWRAIVDLRLLKLENRLNKLEENRLPNTNEYIIDMNKIKDFFEKHHGEIIYPSDIEVELCINYDKVLIILEQLEKDDIIIKSVSYIGYEYNKNNNDHTLTAVFERMRKNNIAAVQKANVEAFEYKRQQDEKQAETDKI